jgi:GNAT superfamily N-acetyltransferase
MMLEQINAKGLRIDGEIASNSRSQWLLAGESVHRELRPAMPGSYVAFIETILAEGAGLTQIVDRDEVRGLAIWRTFTTTYCGLRFEVDDLVTAKDARSRGYGRTLLTHLENKAASLGCPTLTLNSAVYRGNAHRFYFRQGYKIFGFHFTKDVS